MVLRGHGRLKSRRKGVPPAAYLRERGVGAHVRSAQIGLAAGRPLATDFRVVRAPDGLDYSGATVTVQSRLRGEGRPACRELPPGRAKLRFDSNPIPARVIQFSWQVMLSALRRDPRCRKTPAKHLAHRNKTLRWTSAVSILSSLEPLWVTGSEN